MRKRKKVSKLRRARVPNIGVIIFTGIFIYILAYTVAYIYRDKTSVYRVISDTRVESVNSIGIALRNEIVYKASDSGYINYYVNGFSRTGKKDVICTIDSTGNIYSKLSVESEKSEKQNKNLIPLFYQYHMSRKDISGIYSLKNSINETVLLQSGHTIMSGLKDILKNYGSNQYFHVNYAPDSGIIVYETDGMEYLKPSDITYKTFDKAPDHKMSIAPENAGKVEAGQPIYKLITNETWNVVLPVTEEEYNALEGFRFINATIDDSGFSARAGIERIQKNGEFFVVLTFYNYLINFADKRFVNVFFTLKTESGLKIAKSSVVERKFYTVPSDFFVLDKDRRVFGLNKITYNKKGIPSVKFIEVPVYYEKDGYKYISTDGEFSAGDRITKHKDVSTTVSETDSYYKTVSTIETLEGVYIVNRGYPEFRRIEKISDIENDYLLISDSTEYGLSEYDNIILNAKILREEQYD